MSTNNKTNVLSEAFIEDLFMTCIEDSYILSMVCEHLEEEHLPDRNTAAVLKAFKDYIENIVVFRAILSFSRSLQERTELYAFGKGLTTTVKFLTPMNALGYLKNI